MCEHWNDVVNPPNNTSGFSYALPGGGWATFQPKGIGDWKTAFDAGKSAEYMKQYDAQANKWLNTPQPGFTADQWKAFIQSFKPQPGALAQLNSPNQPQLHQPIQRPPTPPPPVQAPPTMNYFQGQQPKTPLQSPQAMQQSMQNPLSWMQKIIQGYSPFQGQAQFPYMNQPVNYFNPFNNS